MSFGVINPGGRDPEQGFPQGAGSPEAPGHAPVNYHAYAACLRSGFYRDVRRLPTAPGTALVLLRNKLGPAQAAIRWARERGWKIWIALKEVGAHQIANFLDDPKRIEQFRALCTESDGALASTPDAMALYASFGAPRVAFVPTPYPVDSPAWNFSTLANQREGIWIGTREFDVASRNHAAALILAAQMGVRVSVLVPDARSRHRVAALGNFHIVQGPLPYAAYLREMSRHRVVFQLDRSRVPGQVAGDALLARVPCVGGDGAIEHIAFPSTNGWGRTSGELADLLRTVLADDAFANTISETAQKNAQDQLSFAAVSQELSRLWS